MTRDRERPTYTNLSFELDSRCLLTLRKAALFLERMRGYEVSLDETLEEMLIHSKGGIRLLQNVTNNWHDLEVE